MARRGRKESWQLEMFSKGLKKRQKLRLLRKQVGTVAGRDCLLVSNGDNNGALNFHLRALGGRWTWVENELEGIEGMEALLGDRVLKGDVDRIPVDDSSFDVVISVDVHEHLDDCRAFNEELFRVARPGATVVVTTPNGDRTKFVCRLKQLVGMTAAAYGHRVIGYTIGQHERMLSDVGLMPQSSGSYAGFFTELVELGINYAYVKVLSRSRSVQSSDSDCESRTAIAPATEKELDRLRKQYRVYALFYPVLRAISKLDILSNSTVGYAVSVVARRPV